MTILDAHMPSGMTLASFREWLAMWGSVGQRTWNDKDGITVPARKDDLHWLVERLVERDDSAKLGQVDPLSSDVNHLPTGRCGTLEPEHDGLHFQLPDCEKWEADPLLAIDAMTPKEPRPCGRCDEPVLVPVGYRSIPLCGRPECEADEAALHRRTALDVCPACNGSGGTETICSACKGDGYCDPAAEHFDASPSAAPAEAQRDRLLSPAALGLAYCSHAVSLTRSCYPECDCKPLRDALTKAVQS